MCLPTFVVMTWLLASLRGGDVWRLGAVPGIMVLKLQHRPSSQWSQGIVGLYGCFSPRAGQSDDRFWILTDGSKPCLHASSSDMAVLYLGITAPPGLFIKQSSGWKSINNNNHQRNRCRSPGIRILLPNTALLRLTWKTSSVIWGSDLQRGFDSWCDS